MRIGVDLDNTTLAFQEHWVDRYNLWFDADIKHEEATKWHSLLELTHFRGYDQFYEWFLDARGWEDMPYIKGAPGGLSVLRQRGHQLCFVTARHDNTIGQTELWHTRSSFADVPLYHEQIKTNVACGVYVDDSPDVTKELVAAGKRVIVFDQPWNRTLPKYVENQIYRATSWGDVLDLVKGMEYSK